MAVLNRARAPRVPKERLCPTRPSTPGFYALPKGELAHHGIMLRSKRTRRRPRRPVGQRTHPIVGMVSIDDRPEDVDDRRVPGHWEGDLIIGNRWHLSGSDPGRAHHPVRDDPGSTRWGRNT